MGVVEKPCVMINRHLKMVAPVRMVATIRMVAMRLRRRVADSGTLQTSSMHRPLPVIISFNGDGITNKHPKSGPHVQIFQSLKIQVVMMLVVVHPYPFHWAWSCRCWPWSLSIKKKSVRQARILPVLCNNHTWRFARRAWLASFMFCPNILVHRIFCSLQFKHVW